MLIIYQGEHHYEKGNIINGRTKKYEVIKGLADHPDSSKERAALTLGCTLRHVNRMLAGYKESGKTYFIHGNKGRKPDNTINAETKIHILKLYQEKYFNANFTHFTELLMKHENIFIYLLLFQKF